MQVAKNLHTLKPNGLHTITGGNWNAVWQTFFNTFKDPTAEEILTQLFNMMQSFALL